MCKRVRSHGVENTSSTLSSTVAHHDPQKGDEAPVHSRGTIYSLPLQQRDVYGKAIGPCRSLPVFGLGTFRMKGKVCSAAVTHAVQRGCRLIDTAVA